MKTKQRTETNAINFLEDIMGKTQIVMITDERAKKVFRKALLTLGKIVTTLGFGSADALTDVDIMYINFYRNLYGNRNELFVKYAVTYLTYYNVDVDKDGLKVILHEKPSMEFNWISLTTILNEINIIKKIIIGEIIAKFDKELAKKLASTMNERVPREIDINNLDEIINYLEKEIDFIGAFMNPVACLHPVDYRDKIAYIRSKYGVNIEIDDELRKLMEETNFKNFLNVDPNVLNAYKVITYRPDSICITVKSGREFSPMHYVSNRRPICVSFVNENVPLDTVEKMLPLLIEIERRAYEKIREVVNKYLEQ